MKDHPTRLLFGKPLPWAAIARVKKLSQRLLYADMNQKKDGLKQKSRKTLCCSNNKAGLLFHRRALQALDQIRGEEGTVTRNGHKPGRLAGHHPRKKTGQRALKGIVTESRIRGARNRGSGTGRLCVGIIDDGTAQARVGLKVPICNNKKSIDLRPKPLHGMVDEPFYQKRLQAFIQTAHALAATAGENNTCHLVRALILGPFKKA